MPNQDETVELTIGGEKYSSWQSATVVIVYGAPLRTFQLQTVEDVGRAAQIKPGTDCTITMAGQLAFTGKVIDRICQYDATNHGVIIKGTGKNEYIHSSATDKGGGQFRGYTWEAIAKKVLGNVGLSIKTKDLGTNGAKPFKNAQIHPGETNKQMLDRLGRTRGITFHEDAKGQLWGTGMDQKGQNAGDKVSEGKNILRGQATISTHDKLGHVNLRGSAQGDDKEHGKPVAQRAANSSSNGGGPPKHFHAEGPLDKGLAQTRLNYENMWDKADYDIVGEVTVKGWLRSDDQLWDVLNAPSGPGMIQINSPMLMLNQSLAIDNVQLKLDPTDGSISVIHFTNHPFASNQDLGSSGDNKSSSSSSDSNQSDAKDGPSLDDGAMDPKPMSQTPAPLTGGNPADAPLGPTLPTQ